MRKLEIIKKQVKSVIDKADSKARLLKILDDGKCFVEGNCEDD